MKLLSIGLSENIGNIREQLEYDCKLLSQQGFHVVLEEIDSGGYNFLGLHIVDGELSFRNYEQIKAVLKNSVSRLLADWVINNKERRIINKLVTDNYFYFNQAERAAVEASALRALADSSARYNLVLNRILEYLENHYEIILDGFLNFRLKDYRLQLTEALDNVVDEFMMEFEYKEFIRLLRYFVEAQEPRAEETHVVIKENNGFTIFDSQGKLINNPCLKDTSPNSLIDSSDNLSHEDYLISTLIMLAPRTVMVHCASPLNAKDLVDTIKNVFNNRVIVCKGCEMCTGDYADKSNPTELS